MERSNPARDRNREIETKELHQEFGSRSCRLLVSGHVAGKLTTQALCGSTYYLIPLHTLVQQ